MVRGNGTVWRLRFEFQTDGPKRERRDPRATGERWATRYIYIYSLDGISLG